MREIDIPTQESVPEVCELIGKQLRGIRESGAILNSLSIRGIMVGIIQKHAPQLFDQLLADGTKFRCLESFVRKYIINDLDWSFRATTCAAQKIPENVEEILTESALREAYLIRKYDIDAALRVNTDQTQTVYQQGTDTTWNHKGDRQVPAVGIDEKRAFTLVPSISASGKLLPFQAIYHGATPASCPDRKSPFYAEAEQLGFRLEPSKSDTYWSTIATMKSLVDDIIAPYFERKKNELGIEDPDNQYSIWKIDCWSVHKSEEFLTWMKTTHPQILVIFVPGNCTCVFQPLDVGIQRVLKQSIKCSAHSDIVTEVTGQLADPDVKEVRLDVTVKTLRNRSLGWLVKAWHDINNPELIKKVMILIS